MRRVRWYRRTWSRAVFYSRFLDQDAQWSAFGSDGAAKGHKRGEASCSGIRRHQFGDDGSPPGNGNGFTSLHSVEEGLELAPRVFDIDGFHVHLLCT